MHFTSRRTSVPRQCVRTGLESLLNAMAAGEDAYEPVAMDFSDPNDVEVGSITFGNGAAASATPSAAASKERLDNLLDAANSDAGLPAKPAEDAPAADGGTGDVCTGVGAVGTTKSYTVLAEVAQQ